MRKLLLYSYDILMVFACSYLALKIIEYDNIFYYFDNILKYSFIVFALTVILFSIFNLYSSLWKYAGIEEFVKISIVICLIFLLNTIFSIITGIVSGNGERFIPFRWCLMFSILQMIFTLSIRFVYRLVRYFSKDKTIKKTDKERIMIIGAGDAGVVLIKEIKNNDKINLIPVCIIDDDITKKNLYIEGVKIVGNRDDIPRLACFYHIDRIIIAIPSLDAKQLSKIIFICQDTKCKIQTLPGMFQMIKGNNILNKVRNVNVEDLLGRDPINVNYDEITNYLVDQVVLVTGGGGSIGSELCRQISHSKPKHLIILDCYENSAYEIQMEIQRNHPELKLTVLIASVRDERKIDDVFNKYRPNIVYHAAAHKHVPLMETSPHEAIKNNVFGTLNVVNASDKYGVKRFIMISTDKAVNPTNIMGASKRICEMIVQSMDKKSKTEFVATRFGNVLGSNGSVIPLFKKQIEQGGPVTVTDKEMVRFFMTITEAVSLVLQAGSYAKGGEIFVLDMGKPVRIYDLAVNLIKLSGFTPDVDIPIKIVGLRPGEKLYEEMLMDEEGLEDTNNKLIFVGKPLDFDHNLLYNILNVLREEMINETIDIRSTVQKLVSTYVYK